MAEDIEPIENNKFPKPNQIDIKLPVDLAISNKTKQLIKTGIQKEQKEIDILKHFLFIKI